MYPKTMKALVIVYFFTFAAFLFLILLGKGSKKVEEETVANLPKEIRINEMAMPCRDEDKLYARVDKEISQDTREINLEPVNETANQNKELTLVPAYSEAEVSVLERIVEAEAGGEDADGNLLVANVVLNRVRDEAFPDTITEVVFQRTGGVTQFSPVANGRYDAVTISEESKEAVERALLGEDISDGALYFVARKHVDQSNVRWFDENLTPLFQHGGHEFFK